MMTLLFFDANAIRNHGTLSPFESVPLIFPGTACLFQPYCSGGAITLSAEDYEHPKDFGVSLSRS
jgi:hypothetical protein